MTTSSIATSVVTAAVLTACTLHTAPPTHAGTPTFPDLASFTPVNVEDYAVEETSPGHTNSFTRFLTPDGIPCSFDTTGEYSAGCTGSKFPGVPVSAPSFYYSDGTGFKLRTGVFGISTDVWLRSFNELPDDTSKLKTLPPMHSITQYGVTCGVDGAGTTACIDPQGRGFMLSPSWSGWLPHVSPGQTLTSAPIHCTQDADTTTCKDGDHGFVSSSDPTKYRSF